MISTMSNLPSLACIGIVLGSYTTGILSSFVVTKAADIPLAISILAYAIGQLAFMIFCQIYLAKRPLIKVPSSPNISPEGSPGKGIEGMRDSQILGRASDKSS